MKGAEQVHNGLCGQAPLRPCCGYACVGLRKVTLSPRYSSLPFDVRGVGIVQHQVQRSEEAIKFPRQHDTDSPEPCITRYSFAVEFRKFATRVAPSRRPTPVDHRAALKTKKSVCALCEVTCGETIEQ